MKYTVLYAGLALMALVPAAHAQELSARQQCIAELRYADGREIDPRNLRIGERIAFRGHSVGVTGGMNPEFACTEILVPWHAESQARTAERVALTRARDSAIADGAANATFRRLTEANVIKTYAEFFVICALFFGFFVLKIVFFVLRKLGGAVMKLWRYSRNYRKRQRGPAPKSCRNLNSEMMKRGAS